jgi:uncharacterized protein YkwD/uncharacterized protein YraI
MPWCVIRSTSSRRRRQVVSLIAGASLFIPGFIPGVAASPTEQARVGEPAFAVEDADACLDSEEIAFLGLINDHRAAAGLRPLSVSASLSAAAAYHSIDMAENGYLDHTMRDGTTVVQNMANFGYQGDAYGENIAAGTETAAAAMQIWQNSPPHNANMLSGQFGAIGIGRAYEPASSYGWYWTTVFGDVSDGPGWLCGDAAPPSKSASLFQSVDGATAASDVNLRSGPAESYPLVETLSPGTAMTVTGAEQQGYVPVKVDGQFGWVATQWIERGPLSLEQTAAPSTEGQPGTATTIDAVELRSAPDKSGAVVTTIPDVTVVSLTGEAQDGFLGVEFDGQQGWADAAYLEVADVASDSTLYQATASTDSAGPSPDNAAPAQPAPQATIGGQAVTTATVNLRSQPTMDSMVLRIVPAGSQISLTGSRANGFVNVRLGGQAGWIDEDYVQ